MPSCHSLTRFVNAFFDGFYPHVPVVHMPTFKLEDCTAEIVLAMAALGAQYRHEHRKAALMFFGSKAIFHRRLQDRQDKTILAIQTSSTPQTGSQGGSTSQTDSQEENVMHSARCAFYLIAFATWQREPEILREASNLSSFLARSVRESGLTECNDNDDDNDDDVHGANTTDADWHAWVEQEADRRVKLFSFALLNLHSMAFHLPAGILADEIQLRLPSSCTEWLAPSRERWAAVRSAREFREQLLLPDALGRLYYPDADAETDTDTESRITSSPLANYILIHALIQRILLVHRVVPQDSQEDIRYFFPPPSSTSTSTSTSTYTSTYNQETKK